MSGTWHPISCSKVEERISIPSAAQALAVLECVLHIMVALLHTQLQTAIVTAWPDCSPMGLQSRRQRVDSWGLEHVLTGISGMQSAAGMQSASG